MTMLLHGTLGIANHIFDAMVTEVEKTWEYKKNNVDTEFWLAFPW